MYKQTFPGMKMKVFCTGTKKKESSTETCHSVFWEDSPLKAERSVNPEL